MDLSGQRVLAYLQEDNTQRMLFRVRPLLAPQGLLAAEEIAAYRDHGFLRVAPDRQEQHTFKERMRDMGPLCLLDLRNSPQGKVRPNRNYAPSRGEHNRYIVYSDAIQALPQDMVYEVVTREENRQSPLTPQYYVRSGGFINGPFTSPQEEAAGGVHSLPPDCDRLFLLLMPDNQHRLFYWPEETERAEPLETPQTAPIMPAPPEVQSPVRSLTDMFFRRRQPLLMPQSGLRAAVAAVEATFTQMGFACDEEKAAHLLLISAQFTQFQLSSPVLADAASAGKALAGLWGLSPVLTPDNAPAEQDMANRLVLSPLAPAAAHAHRHIILSQAHGISAQSAPAYALSPWPVVDLKGLEGWPGEMPAPSPIDLGPLRQLLRQHQGALSPATESRLKAWQRRLSDLEAPLPLKLRHDIACYLRQAKALKMEEHAATSLAAAAFVLPYARFMGLPADTLRALLVDQPHALALL